MAILAKLLKPRGLAARKLEIFDAKGPAAGVSVAAGAGADVSISISPALKNVDEVGVLAISGLPANIGVGNVATSATSITLHAINPTAAAITVSADSVTVKVIVIGS